MQPQDKEALVGLLVAQLYALSLERLEGEHRQLLVHYGLLEQQQKLLLAIAETGDLEELRGKLFVLFSQVFPAPWRFEVSYGDSDSYFALYSEGAEKGTRRLKRYLVATPEGKAYIHLENDPSPILEAWLVNHAQLIYRAINRGRDEATDRLTGLWRGNSFLVFELERELERIRRHGGEGSYLLIDVDRMKRLNDKYGHEAVNGALRRIGEILRAHHRATDVVARFGGDEFAALLPESSEKEAVRFAESIRRIVARERFTGFQGKIFSVTLSIGVANFPKCGADKEAICTAADQAMYRSKKGGRNRVTVAVP